MTFACPKPASSSPEGAGMAEVSGKSVTNVVLLKSDANAIRRLVNKELCHPGEAIITWCSGCTDEVKLTWLTSVGARDVFAVDGYTLVLKLQTARYHNTSTAHETALAGGPLGCSTPRVYGCLECEWQEAKVYN